MSFLPWTRSSTFLTASPVATGRRRNGVRIGVRVFPWNCPLTSILYPREEDLFSPCFRLSLVMTWHNVLGKRFEVYAPWPSPSQPPALVDTELLLPDPLRPQVIFVVSVPIHLLEIASRLGFFLVSSTSLLPTAIHTAIHKKDHQYFEFLLRGVPRPFCY